MITRKWCIGRNNIFLHQRTPIDQIFPRRNPVFQLTQGTVVDKSTSLQPGLHDLLLDSVGIDSISEVHCQHKSSLPQQLCNGKPLSGANFGGIEPRSIGLGVHVSRHQVVPIMLRDL